MSIISQGFLNNRIASIGYTYILKGAGKGVGPYASLDGIEIFLDATNTDSYPGTGNTWYDLSGKGRHATLNNGTAFVGSGNTAYFLFDGTDDSASTGGTNFPLYSFEIVFKNYRRIIPNVEMTNPYYSVFGMSLDGYNSPGLNVGEWTAQDANETLSLWWKYPVNDRVNTYIRDNVDSVPNHLICNWNGSQYDFYLNGTKRTIYASGSGGHTPFMDAIYNISLGKVIAFNYFFKGNISLFKAWNKPLLESEIIAQYNTKKSYLNFTPRTDRTSLVCHYDFSNTLSYPGSGATVYDISGYDNNGTLGGTFTYNSSGDKYVALTSGYINIGNPTTMSVSTGDFTVELWAWVNSSNGLYSKLFSKGSWMTGTSYLMGYTPTVGGAWMELYINSNVAGSVINNTASFNTWRHIIWRRQNGYWDIYVSGTTTTPFYNASDLSNSYNWVIGGNNGFTELNNCRIAHFKLYQRALTNAEIQQSYIEFQNKFYPAMPTLGLAFHVDASNYQSYPRSGTVWYDISGNNYNINLLNGPVYSGEYGGALTFDGTNDYGTTRSLTQLEMGNRSCTIGAWFRTTATTGAIVTKRGPGSGYEHYIYSGGKLYADGYGTPTGVSSVSAINNNTVKYGVVVFDYANLTIRLYINGVADNTTPLTTGGNDTSAYFNIARSQQYTDFFAGTIYSIQVYNRALSATEILNNFNAGRGRFNL
jgi:hypothetical protein